MRTPVAIAAIATGSLLGLGVATFDHAEGTSYLSTDPRACVNCHIMRPQYDAWHKSSHHALAGCVDCHLPADFPANYLAKARNGWHHSRAFTAQDFHEPILITPPNAAILQANCVRCHDGLTHTLGAPGAEPHCTACHADVGHSETVGLGGPMRELPPSETP